jgi:hypothetical protein
MKNMDSHFFSVTYTIIGGDDMGFLVYLNISCALLWFDIIASRRRLKEAIGELQEETEGLSDASLIFIATLCVIGLIIIMIPGYAAKIIKRVI